MPALVIDNLCALTLQCPGFDDLTLTGDNQDPYGNEFSIEACDDNTTWGSPVPVDVSVQRWMSDGAVASTQGFDNREISFQVLVSASTTRELNAAEAAMALREARSCTLVWTSPEGDDLAPASVFDVWTWHFDHEFDGMGERRLQRLYTVTMTAEPFVRDQDLTAVTPIVAPGSPTTLTVDTCTSISGWTGSPNAVTTSGGAVRETVTVPTGGHGTDVGTRLDRVGTVSMTSTPYLALNMGVTGGVPRSLTVYVDNAPTTKVGQAGPVSYWQMPTGITTFARLSVIVDVIGNKAGATVQLAVNDVSKTDTIAGIGSRKQLTRSLRVGGSVKTSGSIQVASPDATPLGTVLLCTAPDNGLGYNPGLRQYRSGGSGTPVVDATAVSGFYDPFGPLQIVSYTIPAAVLPEATYVVVARMKSTAATSITVGGSIFTGAATIGATWIRTVTWTTANTNVWAVLGTVTFPALALPPESTVGSGLNIVSGGGGTGTQTLDEVYLIDVTHGAFSLIDCGTATRLWIDSADLSADNLPHVYTGTQADRSDAATPPYTQITWVGDHDIDPRGSVLASVTDKVNNAAVSWSGYRRGHTHMPAAS